MLRVIVGAHDWTAGEGEVMKIKRKWEHFRFNRYNMGKTEINKKIERDA